MRIVLLIACLLAPTLAAAGSAQDTVDAAEALLRWQVSSNRISAPKTVHFFVSVAGHDLPNATVTKLKDTGVDFRPGSDFKSPDPSITGGNDVKIDIGEPKRLRDGTYEVNWSDYCGMLCMSGNTAILRHDPSGWLVVSSEVTIES